MKAHSVQNYIMSESKTWNCEYMFHCMNCAVVGNDSEAHERKQAKIDSEGI